MKGVVRVPPVASWVCEQWHEAFHLDEWTGPAVGQDERQRSRASSRLVEVE